jgi:hypothetical protein
MNNILKINQLASISLSCLLVFSFCKNKNNGIQTTKGNGDPNNTVELPLLADGSVDTNKVAKMFFDQPLFEFDTVVEGEIITHSFKFKNTGPVALLISDAKSSCGCTIPEWPEGAVEPGQSGEITAKFNTTHKNGSQNKAVRVYANVYPGPAMVTLKGYVRSKEEETIRQQRLKEKK